MENSISNIDPVTPPGAPVGTTSNTRLMVIRLVTHQWYPRKYDKEISREIAEQYGAESADEAGRYNKLLVQAKSIKPLQQAFAHLRDNIHYKYTLPWSDKGERVLPVDLYFDYMQEVREQKEKIEKLVQEFAFGEYANQRNLARSRLNGMFKAGDYPPAAEVARRFGVELSRYPLPNPEDTRVWGIGDEAAAEIEADVRETLDAATAEAHQLIVNQVLDRGKEFISKVNLYDAKVANDDKKARLYDTAIENLRDVVTLVLKGLNVTNDLELTALANQLNGLIDDTDASKLKASAQLREDKVAAVEKTLAKFEGVYGA